MKSKLNKITKWIVNFMAGWFYLINYTTISTLTNSTWKVIKNFNLITTIKFFLLL